MLLTYYWITGLISAGVVVICVLIHYEGLRFLSDLLPPPKHHHRRRIFILILSLLSLHVIEVWMFGIAYFSLLKFENFGELTGVAVEHFFDYVYYSAAVYSTLGFGDITPVGPVRTMTGTEAITGLTLITWSASYTFVEMLKSWRPDD